MTAAELQDQIVRLLANNSYCRYWLNWPSADGKQWMAVSVLQVDDHNRAYFQECSELETKGFRKEIYNGAPLYKIERT